MIKHIYVVLLAVMVSSCGKNVVLDELYSFEDKMWHMDSVFTVTWEPTQSDDPVFMSMYVRHTTDYPFNNLYLFRTIESTKGLEYSDTVNVALADPLGAWRGSGMSNLKMLQIPIGKGAVRFQDDERYTLKITHGMRDTVLYGIQDVGVQFEQVKAAEE